MSNRNARNARKNQQEVVLEHLQNGKTLTASFAKRKMKIANPYEIVRLLRSAGNPIYTNLDSNRRANYRLGTAKKSTVALSYAVNGANSFR